MAEIKALEPPATIIDAEGRNLAYPEKFQIPDISIRVQGQVGCLAKIGFEHPEWGGERFWVQITEVRENGQYVGRVDNDLEPIWGITYNDLVVFEPRHIMDCG